ncbi:hypothetical protein [Halorarum salinum]|uniref:hypothetical protein n=1 Tax=Halorarum salinum TaxID=2743089 RepID=UPI001FE9D8D4|nr:hypothetical protein [Halobaculum salinum]
MARRARGSDRRPQSVRPEEEKGEEIPDDGLAEAANVAAHVRCFPTILHGAEFDVEAFTTETAGIVEHADGRVEGSEPPYLVGP